MCELTENRGHHSINSVEPFWPRELLLALFPLVIGFQVLVWTAYLPIALHGIADFRTLYACGYMTRTGHAHEIYNSAELLRFKEILVPRSRTFDPPMDHPAYEALLFVPLSYLPYRTALLTFIGINFVILGLCIQLISPSLRVLSRRWWPYPMLLFVAFFPINRAILQGQDSVILLALLLGALVCLQRGKDFTGGLLTGSGLFKLQVVIPIALLFLLWRRWRFGLGFLASAVAAVLASAFLVGVRGLQDYGSMLLGMSVRLRTESDAIRYTLSPLTMLNIRGLLSAAFQGRISHWWLQILIIVISGIVIAFTQRRKASMSLAVTAAALVSYHLNAQDASILIIPVGMCLCTQSARACIVAILLLITTLTAIWPLWGYFSAVPLLALYLTVAYFHQFAAAFESANGTHDLGEDNLAR